MLRKLLLLSLLATNAINLQAQQQTVPTQQARAHHGTFLQFDLGLGSGRLYKNDASSSFNLAFHTMGRYGYDFGGFYINSGFGILLLGDRNPREYYLPPGRIHELLLHIPLGVGLSIKDNATCLRLGVEGSLNPCLREGDVYKMISPNLSLVWKNRNGSRIGLHLKGFINIEDAPKEYSPGYIGVGLSLQ